MGAGVTRHRPRTVEMPRRVSAYLQPARNVGRMTQQLIYLVAPTGFPNFGDEYIAAA